MKTLTTHEASEFLNAPTYAAGRMALLRAGLTIVKKTGRTNYYALSDVKALKKKRDENAAARRALK